jgi:hypothetical protein
VQTPCCCNRLVPLCFFNARFERKASHIAKEKGAWWPHFLPFLSRLLACSYSTPCLEYLHRVVVTFLIYGTDRTERVPCARLGARIPVPRSFQGERHDTQGVGCRDSGRLILRLVCLEGWPPLCVSLCVCVYAKAMTVPDANQEM